VGRALKNPNTQKWTSVQEKENLLPTKILVKSSIKEGEEKRLVLRRRNGKKNIDCLFVKTKREDFSFALFERRDPDEIQRERGMGPYEG